MDNEIEIKERAFLESLEEYYSNRISVMNAKHDNIKYHFESDYYKRGHIPIFDIPCSNCGSIIKKKVYYLNKKYICDYCKTELRHKRTMQKSIDFPNVMTANEVKFEKAVNKIKKQVKDINEYSRAIEIAKTRVENYGSLAEMMVAIELIKLKYAIIPQQKIGKYRVDFAIPSHKLIIEVDGKIYHQNYKKEIEREGKIQMMVGLDWRIIHVPAEMITEHITSLNQYIKTYNPRI